MNTGTMIALLGVGVLIFLFAIRYLTNKESMYMIEKGTVPDFKNKQCFQDLRNSLILIGVGTGALLAYYIDPPPRHDFSPIRMISILGGIGLPVSFLIQKKSAE